MNMIKAIIFDVDGTLYRSPQVVSASKQYWVGKIASAFHLSEEEAHEKYVEIKKLYGSTTEGLRRLGFGSLQEISRQTEQAIYQPGFIKSDEKLVNLCQRLQKKFRLILFRNGQTSGTFTVLSMLGFPTKHNNNIYACSIFEKVFSTIDDFGVMKPDLKPFEGVLNYTKLKPNEHLMVGDRVTVDLAPAKKLGMQTALVTWGGKFEKHADVDYYLPTIYDVEKLCDTNLQIHANDANKK